MQSADSIYLFREPNRNKDSFYIDLTYLPVQDYSLNFAVGLN